MRIAKWDYLKFVLIYLVVLGHVIGYIGYENDTLNGIYLWIYSFHMPLFILISGLFAKRSIDEKRWNKIFTYFALMLLIMVANGVTGYLISGNMRFSVVVLSGVPWFAWALFVYSLVTVALRKFPVTYVLPFVVIIGCFIGADDKIGSFLALSRVLVYYPFFYIGYILNPQGLAQALSKTWIKILSAIGLAAMAIVFVTRSEALWWIRPVVKGNAPHDKFGDFSEHGVLVRLVYYVLVLVICAMVIAVTPTHITGKLAPLGRWMAFLGERSVQTYAFHWAVLMVLFKVFSIDKHFEQILPVEPYLLIFPLALAIQLLCSLKPFGWIVRKTTSVDLLDKPTGGSILAPRPTRGTGPEPAQR